MWRLVNSVICRIKSTLTPKDTRNILATAVFIQLFRLLISQTRGTKDYGIQQYRIQWHTATNKFPLHLGVQFCTIFDKERAGIHQQNFHSTYDERHGRGIEILRPSNYLVKCIPRSIVHTFAEQKEIIDRSNNSQQTMTTTHQQHEERKLHTDSSTKQSPLLPLV